jgi:hypothetical protein
MANGAPIPGSGALSVVDKKAGKAGGSRKKIRSAPGATKPATEPGRVFPIRYTATAMLFGEEALAYDLTREATSLLSDDDVAEMLRRAGNPPCPHPEYLAWLRSLIAAHAQMRKAQLGWSKEKKHQHPDEMIARAIDVDVLQRAIPEQIGRLQRELAVVPEEMRPARRREIGRLQRLWAAVEERPHLPLDKDIDDERGITANDLLRHLSIVYDRVYGPIPAWRDSPKAYFIAAALERAGWAATPGAVEQAWLRARRRRTTR